MADIREQNLPLKTTLANSDWVRLVTATGNHRMTVGQLKTHLYTLENWTNVPLLNGWTQTTTPLRYYKNPFGEVRVVGQITGGTATLNTVVGTLPVGYRPAFLNRGVFIKINDGSIIPYILQPNGEIQIGGPTTTGIFAFNFSFRI